MVYAVINWFQSILGTVGYFQHGFLGDFMHLYSRGYKTICVPALLPVHALEAVWLIGAVVCRSLLYACALLWMQMLIAARLDLLDRTSNQKGFSGCFRRLVWLQAVGVMMLTCFSIWLFLETLYFTDQSRAGEAVLLKKQPHPWSINCCTVLFESSEKVGSVTSSGCICQPGIHEFAASSGILQQRRVTPIL